MVKNYYEIARFLSYYFHRNRGVGHTRSIVDGVRSIKSYPRPIVVVSNSKMGYEIQRMSGDTISFVVLDHIHTLEGHSNPIVFDNSALMELLEGLLKDDSSLYLSQHNTILRQFEEIRALERSLDNTMVALQKETDKSLWQHIKERLLQIVTGD